MFNTDPAPARVRRARLLLCVALFLGGRCEVSAEEVTAAVAANFTAAMKEIVSAFEAETAHRLVVSFGSTGQLYAQIVNGAPFQVYLAADQRRPRRLVDQGLGSEPFTYAVGRLVLWSADPNRVDDEGRVLRGADFQRLAMANPKTAPYGAAAVEVLQGLGLYPALEAKLVRGENIAQTFQFVATRNAELGFVAAAQVSPGLGGSAYVIPDQLYRPIRQDAVLLTAGREHPPAKSLLRFLRSDRARRIILDHRYALP